MITLRKLIFPALGVLAVAVVACGGGGGAGSSLVPKGAPTSATRTRVAIKIVVGSAPASAPARIRRRMAEAASTNGLNIVVYPEPQGTSVPAVLTQAFDVSSAGGCTVNADGSRTCNDSLSLTPGSYLFVVTSYDQAPVSGSIPVAAHPLGYQALMQTIAAGGSNAVNLSLDGIAATVNVTLSVPVVHTLTALTQAAAVVVMDAANDAIVANSYVDASGNPVTVTLTSNNGLFAVAPTSTTGPLPNGASVVYDPGTITAAQMMAGVTASITATLSITAPVASATLTVPSALQAVTIGAPAYGITSSSTTLYFSLPGSQAIQSYIPATSTLVAPTPLASSGPIGPSPKPADVLYNFGDTNVYFTMSNNNAIGFIPTVPATTYEQGFSLTANAVSLTSDGTNNVWSTEPSANYLVYTPPSPSAGVHEQPSPGPPPSAGAGLFQIAFGTGDNMWYTENTTNKIGMWNAVSGQIEQAVPTGASGPEGIAGGPNGDMWFAEYNAKQLGEIPAIFPSTITEFTTGPAHPVYVVGAPDGNVWFDYVLPNPGVGRMTPSGTLTLFPLPNTANPGQLTVVGAQIWVVDTANATLYALTP